MLKPQKRSIDKLIRYAQKLWAVEEWKVVWRYNDSEAGAEIEVTFTEKEALITLDSRYIEELWSGERKEAWKRLTRDLVHEVGHITLYPLYRAVSDWADHRISKEERIVFEEMYNSNENIILDHTICKVFHL